MKKLYVITTVLIILIGVIEVFHVFLSNNVAIESVGLTDVEIKIDEIQNENEALKTEILEYASLDVVASRAAELGFADTEQYISLYNPLTVAQR